MSRITNKYVSSATETSVTIKIEASSDRMPYDCIWRIKLEIGSKIAYSDETLPRDFLYMWDGFHVTMDGLSPSKYYTAKLTVMCYHPAREEGNLIIEAGWEVDSDPVTFIVATEGHTPKWDWNGTNYTAIHPDFNSGYSETAEHYTGPDGLTYSALSYFNATAAQTKAAYKAITTGGRTADFSTLVWNDLVDRIARVQKEWGRTARLDNSVPSAYISSIDPVYREWPIIGNMLVTPGRTITADKFNRVVEAIPILITWPWEKELGRKKIKPTDICKGSYFIAVTNALNHWLDLLPYSFSISDTFYQNMSGVTTQIPSSPMVSEGKFSTVNSFIADSVPSVQAEHFHRIGKLSDRCDLYVETGAIPFTSQFNFFYHESTCKSAVVPVYVIGKFTGKLNQPKHYFEFDFSDSNSYAMAVSDHIQSITSHVDLVNPVGCAIGEHSYTFGTRYSAQIGSAASTYLEHIGAYGIVSKFTITPKDEQDTQLAGKIGISGTIDNLVMVGADVLNHDGAIPVIGDIEFSSSVGGSTAYNGSLSITNKFDIRSTEIVPLELSGEIGIVAAVDNMRIGEIYEISKATSDITISTDAAIKSSGTKNLGGASTSVGIDATASSNTDNLVEVSSETDTTLLFVDAFLHSQKDVPISGTSKTGVKSQSEASVARYQFAEATSDITIISESEAVFKRPTYAEGAASITTEETSGEVVCKPYITSESDMRVNQTSEAEIYAINMTHTKMALAKAAVVAYGTGELITVKGQKDTETEHIITTGTNGILEYTVSAYTSGLVASKIDAIASVDKVEGRKFESTSEVILVASEASVSIASVSLVPASDIEDILVSDIEDTPAYEVERRITIIDKEG